MKKVSKSSLIRQYLNANPDAKATEVAKKFKVVPRYVHQIKYSMKPKKIKITPTHVEMAKRMGIPLEVYARHSLPDGRLKTRMQASFDREPPTPPITTEDPRMPKFDNVNHPAHYKAGGIETIDFIEAKELGYHLGNVIKYVTRAKHKGNEIEDLKKAQWYLNREISRLTGEKA